MRNHRKAVFLAAIFAALGLAAFGQSAGNGTGAGGTVAQGFNVQTVIVQLSLYLPQTATQSMYGAGFRQGGNANAAQGAGGQNAQSGQQRPQVQFERDAKLYLTKVQVAKLLPILQGLRDNPMPSPLKAKTVQADLDGILTAVQKAEYDQYLKAVAKLRQSFQTQANGTQTQPGAARQAGGQQTTSQLQRRQQMMDAFIKVLQEYAKS